MAHIVRLIYTEERRGMGKAPDDPVRLVKQWWTLKGELLFEIDTWTEEQKRDSDES